MIDRLHIRLSLHAETPSSQEFEMTIPLPLLYAGFKVSFLATEAIEELIFKLLKESASLRLRANVKSDSLEELLLSLDTQFSVNSGPVRLEITSQTA